MSGQVPDAGNPRRHGKPGEVYRCPRSGWAECGDDCGMCGGSGYRSVCNRTACHEHGCSFGTCGSTKAEFDAQQSRKARAGGQDE